MVVYSTYTIFSNTIFRQPLTLYRYIRNVSRRGGGPNLLKGTVKKNHEYDGDDFSKVSNYEDLIKTVKSVNINELEIEKAFISEGDFGTALPKEVHMSDKIREDEQYRLFVKKRIIGRKYFKMDLETNLLTCVAKEQIRYLHRTNPVEWTPELLSQSFPITVTGVKKLLKSNYVLKTPERIKQHDQEVEERWKALESEKTSELISPYTQRMWDEGKIMKQNYKSNPNLPTPLDDTKTVLIENKNVMGEYSAIIQQYVNYTMEKESPQIKPSAADELLVSDGRKNTFINKKKVNQFRFNKYRYHIDDETNDSIDNKNSTNSRKSKHINEMDVLHSQFKINSKEEKSSMKFTSNPQNLKLADQFTVKKPGISRKPLNPEEIFTKIPKYKKESIELKYGAFKSGESFYLYDNLGYQHPKGKVIKDKIDLPANSNKRNTLYKVGQCVYDANGEFLYKISVKK